jgi:tetratricopeptide (TPR) repeat protein
VRRLITGAAIIALLFLQVGWIGSWSRLVKRGNEHYRSGDYNAALETYRSAVNARDDALAQYNFGAALYKIKQYEQAANAFRRALDAKDAQLRAQAYYNLGNTHIQLNDLEGAVGAYKSALRLNPNHQNAKYNLELALERLAQQQALKNQSGSNNQEQQQEQGGQDNFRQPQQNQNASEQNQLQEAEQTQSETQQEEISKEDAIRLLDALKDDEKEIQKKVLRKRFTQSQRPEKDW